MPEQEQAAVNRDTIALAALDLVDREGAQALTMKRLAERLDRKAPSLYNHVDGKREVIELMRAALVARIDTAGFARADWAPALAEWARSYLAAFTAHPNSIELLATTAITDPSTLRMYETVVAALRSAGWRDGSAVAVMRAVEAHVLGAAIDLAAPPELLSLAALPAGLDALAAELDPAHEERSGAGAAFEIGLRALLRGLTAEAAERELGGL